MRRPWMLAIQLALAAALMLSVCGLGSLSVVSIALVQMPALSTEGLTHAYECARLPGHADRSLNLHTATLWMRGYVLAVKEALTSARVTWRTIERLPARAAFTVDRLILAECLSQMQRNK